MDSKRLTGLLRDFREQCGYETTQSVRLPDGTEVLGPYRKGRFAAMDVYRGSRSFEGSTLIAGPLGNDWLCQYSGRVNTENTLLAEMVYNFLKTALREFPW